MGIALTVGDVLASIALVLSIVSTVATIRFNSKQKSLIESQELLNQRLLAREEGDARADRQAVLRADLVKLAKTNWRLKIFNEGRAPARNVTIEPSSENELLIQSDIDSKFPLEVLEPMQGVELHARVYLGSKSKHAVTLRWEDEFTRDNEKTVWVTL